MTRFPEGFASEFLMACRLLVTALPCACLSTTTLGEARETETTYAIPGDHLDQWHDGRVRHRGEWRNPEEVHRILATDPVWLEYEALLSDASPGIDDQIALAEWCGQVGLEDEGQFHWRNVVRAAPNHKKARAMLGLKFYQGGLFTDDEIEELKQRRREAEDAFKEYEPRLKALVREATTRDAAARSAALDEIAAIDDAAAIAAICDVVIADPTDIRKFARKIGSDEAHKLAEALQIAAVTAFGQMPAHSATLTLLEFAVYADSEEVRRSAASELKSRPKTDYVPLLMAALAAPIEATIRVHTSPLGHTKVSREFYQPGADFNVRNHFSNRFVAVVESDSDNAFQRQQMANARNLNRATAIAMSARADVDAANAEIHHRNRLIKEALTATTGMEYGDNIENWWNGWESYNELEASYRPTIDSSFASMHVRVSGRKECFAAGTSVWTKARLKPIEQVRVGDQVLSQDPKTGELSYRFVSGTTLRQETRMYRLSAGGEEVITTRGHRFWVVGEGWRMVGQLKPRVRLYSIAGPRGLASVDALEKGDVYNLVVEDFHTYFVGNTKLLVHDSHCPSPVFGSLPGSASAYAR